MRWGRKHHAPPKTNAELHGARGIILFGSVLCALFLIGAAAGRMPAAVYPETMAEAARQAFLQDHATLSAMLALDEYFPEKAVYTGAFELPAGERWTFGRYLRDAFSVLLFGEGN